jgi:hypothetical protein
MSGMKLDVVDRMTLPEFSIAIADALEAKGKNIKWLADQVGTTYEHIRKLIRGEAFPSRLLLPHIINALGLNKEKVQNMVISDRLRKEFGGIPDALAGKTPRMVKIESVLEKLTDEQFDNLLGMAQGMADINRVGRTK